MSAVERPLIIGVGNPDRGDDGVGPEVARLLAGSNVDTATCHGEATSLMRLFEGRRHVEIIDACVSGAAAGTLTTLDVSTLDVPANLKSVSSHGFGVAEAVALARVLGHLPERVILHAIDAEQFEMGAGLSPAVVVAAQKLVQRWK